MKASRKGSALTQCSMDNSISSPEKCLIENISPSIKDDHMEVEFDQVDYRRTKESVHVPGPVRAIVNTFMINNHEPIIKKIIPNEKVITGS